MVRPTVTRRRLLGTLGTMGAVAVAPGVAAAGRTDPPGQAPSSRVSPWPGVTEVPAGHWIVHRLSWNERWGENEPNGDRAEALDAMDQFLDEVETEVSVAGEELTDPNQYWTEPVVHEEEQVVESEWRYVTPPKSPGTAYVYEFAFLAPVQARLPQDDPDHEPDDPENVAVVKRSRGNGGN